MPGAIDEIGIAEAEIERGEAIGADKLRRLMARRVQNGRNENRFGPADLPESLEWSRTPTPQEVPPPAPHSLLQAGSGSPWTRSTVIRARQPSDITQRD